MPSWAIAVAAGSGMTLVASSRPPSPTSTTHASAGTRAKARKAAAVKKAARQAPGDDYYELARTDGVGPVAAGHRRPSRCRTVCRMDEQEAGTVPFRRPGRRTLVLQYATVVAFLCGPDAGWVTGQIIEATGGGTFWTRGGGLLAGVASAGVELPRISMLANARVLAGSG